MAHDACERPAGRSALLAALLCSHCALTAVAALAGVGVVAIPQVAGIEWAYVVPPVAFLTLFVAWLWWGARRGVAAEPDADDPA